VNVTSLADEVITAAKFDECTAFRSSRLNWSDTGCTSGADGDSLETLLMKLQR
jgi:hypothetical protein